MISDPAVLVRLLVLTLLAACAVEEEYVELEGDEEVVDDPDPDGKQDAALVWFTPITKEYFLPSAKVATESRKVFRSESEWKDFFGAASPGIDWSKNWAIFYTPGTQRPDLVMTPGWRARVNRVSLSSTGKTLSITTRLEMNGASCPARSARPFVTATIPKQTLGDVAYKRFYKSDITRECE